jgi:hypothetical protein
MYSAVVCSAGLADAEVARRRKSTEARIAFPDP